MAFFIRFLLCAKNHKCFTNTSNLHKNLKVLFISVSRYQHLCPFHCPVQPLYVIYPGQYLCMEHYILCEPLKLTIKFLCSPNQRQRKWYTYTFNIYRVHTMGPTWGGGKNLHDKNSYLCYSHVFEHRLNRKHPKQARQRLPNYSNILVLSSFTYC